VGLLIPSGSGYLKNAEIKKIVVGSEQLKNVGFKEQSVLGI